jgi:acyl transferase domain-containing protein
VSKARGEAIKAAACEQTGTMAAVMAAPDAISRVLGERPDVWVANLNSPRQTVLAGTVDAIAAAVDTLSAAGIPARRIPVSCAFHSPLVQGAARLMADLLDRVDIQPLQIPVFSNTLAAPYPNERAEIRRILAEHITAPVRFAEQLEAMHSDGARIFVEVGPRAVLSNLTRETLSAKRPLILSIDSPDRHGVTHLLHVVAQLAVAGVQVDFDELNRGRAIETIQLGKLVPTEKLAKHVWMVSGGRTRRQDDIISNTPRQNTSSINAAAAAPIPPATAIISQDEPMQSKPPNTTPQFVVDPGSDDVMRQFQQLMSQFLQTQAQVMTTYLQGTPAAGVSTLPMIASPASRVVAAEPFQPAAPSVQHVAVSSSVAPAAAAPQPLPPAPPKPAPELNAPVAAIAALASVSRPAGSAARAGASASDVLSQLLDIVADRTGYPQDMLDADANIEADLGIDSIKRMEILTAFQQLHAGTQRGAFQGAMEKLTAIKTLRETASVLAELLAGQTVAAVA